MNSNDVDLALRRQVECVVRPLEAEFERKMRIREELLALLEQIYAEELVRTNNLAREDNARAAIERTLQRFGEPQSLTTEIQSTVPRHEVWATWLDRRLARLPAASTHMTAGRLALVMLLMLAACTAIAEGLLLIVRGSGLDFMQMKMLLALAGLLTINTFGIAWLGEWFCRSVEQTSGPIWRVPRLWLSAILAISLLALTGIGMMSLVGGTTRDFVWAAHHWLTMSPLAAVVYLGVALLVASQRRRIWPWKQLEIQ